MNSICFYFSFIIIFLFSCKLNLNNPSDPTSRDFFLTNLMRLFLSSDQCLNFKTWKKTYGTGTSKTTGSDIMVLSNGDYLVSGVTRQYILTGSPVGVTNNFAGSNGITLNTFLMRVSKENGDILWVDYLGEATVETYFKPNLNRYSNGDISVAMIVTGASQPSPLNAKSGIGIPSLFVGRIKENGTRVWYTYLDSPSIGETVVSAMDTSNRLHVFIENIWDTTSVSHAPFVDGPAIINTPLGGSSDSDFIHLAVNENGFMSFQRFFTSAGGDYVFGVDANTNGLFISGTTSQGANGTIHPNMNTQTPFVMKVNEVDGTIIWYQYFGISAEGDYGPFRFYLKDDQMFLLGNARNTFGSPTESLVAADGTIKHFLLTKFNTNGTFLWNSFLGSNSEATVDFSESEPLFLSSSQLLFRTLSSSSTGRYTSSPNSIIDTATGVYPLADIFVNPVSGEFNRFNYQSNLTSPTQEKTEVMKEICSGKLVRLNYTKFTSANFPENTQISIENVNLP